MRRTIADRLKHSVLDAPHVTAMFDCDFSAIIAHRKRHRDAFDAQGAKLTFTAYIIRAAVAGLHAVPEVNSRWHDDALEVFEGCNVGIGTALGDEGLVVPVLHDADGLSLLETARRLTVLTHKARTRQLSAAELRGSTFTISNHGVTGSLVATPIIINPPESAILGIGKLEKRAVIIDVDGQDQVVARPMCYVTLTIDHRVLDAFHTNRFLTVFKETIEGWPLDVA